MKINAVITQNSFKSRKFLFNRNSVSLVTFIIAVISVIFGAIFYITFKDMLDAEINKSLVSFTETFISKSKPEIFTGLLLNALLFCLILLLLSTSIIGDMLIYTAVFFKLTGISVLVSHIYSIYGLKGIEYCILILFPGKLIFILSVVLICDYCVFISKGIRNKGKIENEASDFKKQVTRIIVIFVVVIIYVLIDFLLNIIFSGLFDF